MHEISTHLLRECEGPTVLSVDAVENDSEFSRLISVSQIQSLRSDATFLLLDCTDEHVSHRNALNLLTNGRNENKCNSSRKCQYYSSVIAVSFMILHLCFTSFSHSSEAWSESVLILQSTLQFLTIHRRTFCSYDLPTLFIRIRDSCNVFSFAVLWLMTYLVPMVFLIFLLIWVSSRYIHTAWSYRLNGFINSYKSVFQLMIRWTMAVAFVQIVFALNDLGAIVQLTHSTAAISTKIAEGFSSYVFGITFAILSTAVLCLSDACELSSTCPPDPSSILNLERATERPFLMHALEEKSQPVVVGSAVFCFGSHVAQDTTKEHVSSPSLLPFWKVLIISQIGITSLLLIVPSLFLTALRFEYKGAVSGLIESSNVAFSMYEMPLSLFEDCIAAGTSPQMIRYLGVVLISFSFLCPFIALVLAVLIWFAPPVGTANSVLDRNRLKRFLRTIHTGVGGVVFSFALLSLDRSVIPLDIKWSVAKNTTRIPLLNEQLFSLSGECHLEFGYWVFFTQSILLEAFIYLTNSWS